MSGGVDSSVTAALLAREGFEVIGLTMQLYNQGKATATGGKTCCAGQDIRDAAMVAQKMGFPHYVLNYEEHFKTSVINDFADTYLSGETPIPCVRCNQTVKFRDMLGAARDLGADFLATGHYVKRVETENGLEMHKAADTEKDQSYFLFATTRQQLEYLRFPLGNLRKSEIRAIASDLNLPVATKPDSQDICFVPTGKYTEVIEKFRPGALDKGDIKHIDGRLLGQHNGIINFTVGQRRGLSISYPVPLYVVRIDAASNTVYAGELAALAKAKVKAKDFNWLKPGADSEINTLLKCRSTSAAVPAVLKKITDSIVEATFIDPQMGISPGQALVAYNGDTVIGGGWITDD